MKIRRSDLFLEQYTKLPLVTRKKVDRQLRYLVQDLRHPGVRAKKVSGALDIWEARIDLQYRFTFLITDDLIVLRKVGTHDILKKP